MHSKESKGDDRYEVRMDLGFSIIKLQRTGCRRKRGQDLIEYALVESCALIALAATAGMGVVATDINAAFNNVGAKLVTYTG